MISTDTLDEVTEPLTLAASTLGSPLAEVPAQAVAGSLTPAATHAAVAATDVAAPVVPGATSTAAPLAAAAPAAATTVASTGKTSLGTLTPATPSTWPMLGALLLVVGLILVLGKLVRHLQNRQAGKGAALQLKGGLQVGGKERVVWMQAGETHLLLGVSPGRVQTLHVFEVPPDFSAQPVADTATTTPETTPASRDFSERLKTLLEHARAKGIETHVPAAPATAPVAAARPPEASPRAATSKPTFSFRA